MSATGAVGAPGLWESVGTALRLLLGWSSVLIGVLDLVVELDRRQGTPDSAYLLFHGMLVVGGVLLISLASIAYRPSPAVSLVGGLVLGAGLLVSAVPADTATCCLDTFAQRHGYPFAIMARNPGGDWHVDGLHLAANVLFWGYAGLIALLLSCLARRLGRPHEGTGCSRP
ncbi:hypothetical protein [Couchioplanes caeruleus]|uniref:Uncharacterized protein n=2 Tax=Couchioplanes caeruleus TaxID=56438 RepID=A0A1K0GFN9_9ACTN|nr:hypothetical protein [Couchioplanes caeruleus]OJF09660.1 hypothetical protein BG844_36450 [Couchioplanes caeruleus subsp. caeruleus]ROP31958.1 hypothetical protein EDD30_4886 [Couchioplanes caeruleus]